MTRRNVILITADSVRADYSGFLNSALETTPYLTEISKEGLVFENAVAPGPRTLSSMPAIFTGERPLAPAQRLADSETRMDRINSHMRSHRSIAELFSQHGYTTIGFTTNPWTWETTDFDSGFDDYNVVAPPAYSDQFPFTLPLFDRLYHRRFGRLYRQFMNWHNSGKWFSQWPTFFDEIVETVRDVDEPYFLWVFLLDTHNPYIVPRAHRVESSTVGMYRSIVRSNSLLATSKQVAYDDLLSRSTELNLKKAYRDSIRSVDRFVYDLHDEVRQDDPVLVFHSDHGEAFGEHGTYGHQSAMYAENIHVPLLVYGTGESGRVSQTVSLTRLPDLLERYAIETVSPALDGEYAIAQDLDGDRFAIRDDDWKLVLDTERDERERRLYDLRNDPAETLNVIDEYPEVGADLEERLTDQITEVEVDVSGLEIAPSVEEHLQSLGYQ